MQGLAAFCGSAGGKTSRLSPNVSRARKRARDKQLRFQLFAMGFSMPCAMFGYIGNASAPLPAALACRKGQGGLIVSFSEGGFATVP
jgi:hypothetical protein